MGTTVDFSELVRKERFSNTNIFGPYGAGKTSFLNAIRQYNADNNLDSENDGYADRHFVIFLDFSDYSGKTYKEAICYFRKKISELFVSLYEKVKDELVHYSKLEWYLDIEEGKCDEKQLRHSLMDIVKLVRYGKNYPQYFYRPIIIIDEVSRPILYASIYKYADALADFYDDFFNIDHYEMTAGIITTSYAPVNTDVDYHLKYICNVPVNLMTPFREICAIQDIKLDECQETLHFGNTKYFNNAVSFSECFEKMMTDSDEAEITDFDYDIDLPDDVKYGINRKRIWISVQKNIEREARLKQKEKERREYAEPLMWGTYLPSRFAGIRDFAISKYYSQQRRAINGRLKELYEKYGKSATAKMVYSDIQHIGGTYYNVPEIRKMIVGLKKYAEANESIKSCSIDIDDPFWAKINVEKNGQCRGDMSLLKVYFSVKEAKDVQKVFDKATRFLIDEGKDLFHAKVSIRERNDHICLWVSNEDFYKLARHMSEYDELLHTPLEFVPYSKKIGITREFYSWSSYNGLVSELIALYLQNISSEDDIDVMDMYSKYVRAWNGDLEENDSFCDRFKASNAQELIILLESMDVIINDAPLHDDNIIYNSNGKMWCALGKSKNWHEVGLNMKIALQHNA